MIDEIIDMFGLSNKSEKQVTGKVNYLRKFMSDQEIFAYMESCNQKGITFYSIDGKINRDGVKKQEIGISMSEYIIVEIKRSIELLIQDMMKAEDACPVTKENYVNIKSICIENGFNVMDIKNKMLNSVSNEFELQDSGRVELKQESKVKAVMDVALSDLTWLRLENNLYKRYMSLKKYVIKKAVIDYFFEAKWHEEKYIIRFRKDSFQLGLLNLFSDLELLRDCVVKALTINNNSDDFLLEVQKKINKRRA